MSTFGERLKQARKRRGLTQDDVAKKLGVDFTSVSKWENNKAQPSNETLVALAGLYESEIEWLITGKGVSDSTSADEDKELSDILEEFKRQMEGKPLTDEEKRQVLNTVTEVILSTKDKSYRT